MLLSLILLYITLNLAAGLLTVRLVKNSADFINAGRRLPMLFNATALFALWFGSETILGATSEFAQHGLIGVIEDPFGAALCLILFAAFFARKLYRLNLLTINDLFRIKYGPKVELWSSIFMILTFLGWVAAQFVALGILLHSIAGLPVSTGIMISAVVVTLYTMTGGMWAISITDFIQSIMIIVGLVWVSIVVTTKAGGIENVFESAPAGFFRFLPEATPLSITEWLVAWSIIGLGSLSSQDVFQRVNAARSEKAAVRSTYLGGLLYLIFGMLPLYIALSARVLQPGENYEDMQSIIPSMIQTHTSLPVQAIFFGALVSAILSTCSGALLAPASVLSENVIRPFLGKRISEKAFLLVLRSSVVLFAVLALIMSLSRRNIYALVAESSILGMVSLLVPLVLALYSRRHYPTGAMWSMFAGILAWLVSNFVLHLDMLSVPVGLAASVLGMVLGIAYDRSLKITANRSTLS